MPDFESGYSQLSPPISQEKADWFDGLRQIIAAAISRSVPPIRPSCRPTPCVRTITGERSSWAGSASDLLRLCAEEWLARTPQPQIAEP
jgi:hypothetical protein